MRLRRDLSLSALLWSGGKGSALPPARVGDLLECGIGQSTIDCSPEQRSAAQPQARRGGVPVTRPRVSLCRHVCHLLLYLLSCLCAILCTGVPNWPSSVSCAAMVSGGWEDDGVLVVGSEMEG